MSTEHTGPYCTHKDKMQMERTEAQSLARRLKLSAYRCKHCGTWHVAHKTRPMRPNRRRAHH